MAISVFIHSHCVAYRLNTQYELLLSDTFTEINFMKQRALFLALFVLVLRNFLKLIINAYTLLDTGIKLI